MKQNRGNKNITTIMGMTKKIKKQKKKVKMKISLICRNSSRSSCRKMRMYLSAMVMRRLLFIILWLK